MRDRSPCPDLGLTLVVSLGLWLVLAVGLARVVAGVVWHWKIGGWSGMGWT